MPAHVRSALPCIADEIKERYYGCGSPIPLAVHGLSDLDLGLDEIENAGRHFSPESLNLVISNCVTNLVKDKEASSAMHTTDYLASGFAKGMRIQVQQSARRRG
jgi:hypothetical protein